MQAVAKEMVRVAQRRSVRWALIVAATVLIATQVAVALVVLASDSWARGFENEQRLLPGTVVAGVDVGGLPLEEARAAVDAAVEERLTDTLTVTAGDETFDVEPDELGARAESADAVDEAMAIAADARWFQLTRMRWFDETIEVGALLGVAEHKAATVAGDIAAEVDRDPRDASLEWSRDSGLELIEHRNGRELDVDALTADLAQAMRDGDDSVEAAVEETPVEVATDEIEPHLDDVRRDVDQMLGHQVEVASDNGHQWSVTPADVGAEPDIDAILADRLGDRAGTTEATAADADGSPLRLSDEQVAEYVAGLASEVDVPARNAEIDSSSGWVEFREGAPGEALDRESATNALSAALRGSDDRVDVTVGPSQPSVTVDDFKHVLLLRQNERMLYHYVNGRIEREWNVAVGAGGSPTPTGIYRVGAKRHMPTWNNPDPSGWGSDMPASIPPGEGNPLGVRALNWMDGGRDTLIRFHGTAYEGSLGNAASRGCVRLSNPDVVELYNRVPSGATIVSING